MEAIAYSTNFSAARERHWWVAARLDMLDAVLRKLPRPATILDYGAGSGALLPLYAQFGSAVGVEPSAQARELAESARITLLPPEALAPERQFELVAATDVIEHVLEDAALLRSLADRVSPGGHLLLTVPAFSFLWNYNDRLSHHERRYSRRLLIRRIEDTGLELTWVSYWNLSFLPAVALAALRDFRRSRRPLKGNAERYSYLELPPKWVNEICYRLLSLESRWIASGRSLPFGVSLVALARKKLQP